MAFGDKPSSQNPQDMANTMGLLQAALAVSNANQRGQGLGSAALQGLAGYTQGAGAAARYGQEQEQQKQRIAMQRMQEQAIQERINGERERKEALQAYLPNLPESEQAAARAMGLDKFMDNRRQQSQLEAQVQNWKEQRDIQRAQMGQSAAQHAASLELQRERLGAKEGHYDPKLSGYVYPDGRFVPAQIPEEMRKPAGPPNKATETDDIGQLKILREAISGIDATMAQYDTALGLLDRGVKTGPTFGGEKMARRLGSVFDQGDAKALADMEALEAMMEQLKLNKSKFMKGAISNYEQKIMELAAGSTKLPPESLREVLTVAKTIEQRLAKNTYAARDYFEKHGTFSGYRPLEAPKAESKQKDLVYNPATGRLE